VCMELYPTDSAFRGPRERYCFIGDLDTFPSKKQEASLKPGALLNHAHGSSQGLLYSC